MKTKSLTLLVALIVSFYGCKTTDKPNDKTHIHARIGELRTKAMDHYRQGQFGSALVHFEELDSIQPNTPETIYHLGICYYELESEKSIKYFEKCLESKDIYPASLHFYAGESYHLNHDFKKAIEQFNTYKTYIYGMKGKHKDYETLHILEKRIEQCETGIALSNAEDSIEVFDLTESVNSIYPDYAPVLSLDERTLYFTSERPNTTGGKKDFDGAYNEDIYRCVKNDAGEWSKAEKININTESDDACVSITPDGLHMIVYHFNKEHLLQKNSGDLYMTELEGDTWGPLVKLDDKINSHAWESGASMVSGRSAMYFSSNRKGGNGGTDIYYIQKTANGAWAEPQNLGDIINTPFDEDSPFISADGKTLYFSSNGHKTMGGFDIFRSVRHEETGTWSEPENLGYKINTAHDDIHFYLSADGTRIYFASKREETKGDKDIYMAKIGTKKSRLLVLHGRILDSLTTEPIKATIKVFNKQTKELLGIYRSDSKSGKYVMIFNDDIKYDVNIEADGYTDCVHSIDGAGVLEYEERDKDIVLCPDDEDK